MQMTHPFLSLENRRVIQRSPNLIFAHPWYSNNHGLRIERNALLRVIEVGAYSISRGTAHNKNTEGVNVTTGCRYRFTHSFNFSVINWKHSGDTCGERRNQSVIFGASRRETMHDNRRGAGVLTNDTNVFSRTRPN